jgi:hypothetical protein
MPLPEALFLDLTTVLICLSALIAHGGLRHSHPAVLYLVFHVLVFSLRGYGVANGAETYLWATPEELSRALIYADAFLVCLTVGWLTGSNDVTPDPMRPATPINGRLLVWTALFTIPIGMLTLARYAYIPGVNSAPVSIESSYQIIAQTWPAVALSALIYKYRLRWFLISPLLLYFLLIALQGQGRYRLVIPAILLMQIYLDQRGRKWPTLGILAGGLALMFLFFPLKDVGKQVQAGASFDEIKTTVSESISGTARGQDQDQAIADQLGIVLTETDRVGKVYYGQPYLNLITLPVPRPWWPEKPSLADHIKDISTISRPLGSNGAVTTIVGEMYMNFRLPGIAVGGFLIARLTQRAYRWAYSRGVGSVQHLAYLILVASSFQVLRDGLISLLTFVLVKNLPLVMVLFLHRRAVADTSEPAEQKHPSRA